MTFSGSFVGGQSGSDAALVIAMPASNAYSGNWAVIREIKIYEK